MRIFLIITVLLLSSCNSVKRTMGILQETPDEYTIMPQRKLEVPDQIYLPPPEEHMDFTSPQFATENTKAILLGENADRKISHNSQAENALLNRLPTKPEPNIRKQVNKDRKVPEQWQDQILFWQKHGKDKTLDAAQEAQKLKKESAAHEVISPRS